MSAADERAYEERLKNQAQKFESAQQKLNGFMQQHCSQVPQYSQDLRAQQRHRDALLEDIKQLQSQKSGLLAKEQIYEQLARAKAKLTDKDCRVTFLESQNKKKDEHIR